MRFLLSSIFNLPLGRCFAKVIFFMTFFCFALLSHAYAEFRVCNASQSLVGVAIGYRSEKGWVSKGWWHISPSHCETIIEGPLEARFYYLHAEDARNDRDWEGPVPMCLRDTEFHIEGTKDCYVRGFQRAGFFEIDTGRQTRWTVQLTDSTTKNLDIDSQESP